MLSSRGADHCAFFNRVESIRATGFDNDLNALTEFFAPQSHGFFGKNKSTGISDRTKIFDSTPERALEDLSSALFTMMIDPSKKYLNWEILDPDASETYDVADFLQDAEEYVMKVFASDNSNFFESASDVYESTPLYGQSYITMMKDPSEKEVKFSSIPTQEGYVQRDQYKKVTAFFRKSLMTARQIRVEFKDKRGGEFSAQDWEELATKEQMSPNTEMQIIQLITKKGDVINQKSLQPYTSIWIDYTKKKILSEEGLDYFPILAPTWKLRSGEPYGRGVGHRALADTAVLHQMVKDNMGAAQAMVRPAIAAPFGLVLDDQIDLSPQAINWTVQSAASLAMGGLGDIKPIHVIGELPIALGMEDRRREGVQKTFYADLLMEFKNAEMSATESSQNLQARIAKLTSPFIRLEYGFLAPAAMFVLQCGLEFKHLVLPEQLKGKKLKPIFTTALYDTMKAMKLSKIERALSSLGNTAGLPPTILNGLLPAKLNLAIFDLAGADLDLIRDPDETEKMNEEMRKREADNQQAQTIAGAGSGLKDLSQAFTNTQGL